MSYENDLEIQLGSTIHHLIFDAILEHACDSLSNVGGEDSISLSLDIRNSSYKSSS